ncbi:MAG: nucleotidyl transferase AbiEii/AbiGii toxin family protein [Patescibacteria group bacterium]|nr:nucleotidyl transferase AbiEii/AbiGii toxin family protein [Patescibacteria group bacterium]
MHNEILNKKQRELLPKMAVFSKDFYLVGGTAIALVIGHRSSIDFDFFTNKEFDNEKIRNTIAKIGRIERVVRDEKDHYEIFLDGVRITFLYYPFEIKANNRVIGSIKTPDLLTLAAMKLYALGRRAKWKDYIDMYYILEKEYSLLEVINRAKKIFGEEFSEKNARVQLAYFKDIDFSEKVIFMPGFRIKDEDVKKSLILKSVDKV